MDELAKRNVSLDIFKVLMAFMVVGIHCKVGYQYSYVTGEFLVDGIFRIAVPVFFIINGYFLYDVVQREKTFTWVKRVLAMYLVWMLVYSYFWFDSTFLNGFSVESLVKRFFIGYAHLWYVAAMILSALIILTIHRLYLPFLIFSIVLLFFCGVFIQYAGNYHLFGGVVDEVMNKLPSHRNALFIAFPFMFLGFLIRRYDFECYIANNQLLLLLLLGVGLGVVEVVANILFSPIDQDLDNMVYLILLCPVIFLLILKVKIESSNKYLSEYASAIYFIHFAVLLSLGGGSLSNLQLAISVVLLSSLLSIVAIYLNKYLKIML